MQQTNFYLLLIQEKNTEWLKEYIRVRKELGVITPKYVYLTVASITDEIASLLKEAGVIEVYLGVDHFDTDALKEENKSHRSQKRLQSTLDALKQNGIKVRMGLIVGSSSETHKSLKRLKEGVL